MLPKNPATTFSVKRAEVKGLWKALAIDLCQADYLTPDKDVLQSATVLFDGTGLIPLETRIGEQLHVELAVLDGSSLYVSWTDGSGIVRSQLGRISRSESLTLVDSPSYRFDAPPFSLMLHDNKGAVSIERARATGFQTSTGGKPLGFLQDDGDRLIIVDPKGHDVVAEP